MPHWRPAHSWTTLSALHRALWLSITNVGLGPLRKLPHCLSRCAELVLDVVALQEAGDPGPPTRPLSPFATKNALRLITRFSGSQIRTIDTKEKVE